MSHLLADSYKHCCQIARRTAKNFYYSFTGLPPHQFRAMCALYAYMRICDDIGDDESRSVEQRRVDLQQWEDDVRACFVPGSRLAGLVPPLSVLPAVADVVSRFSIPHAYFFDVIVGMRMDLEPSTGSPQEIISRSRTRESSEPEKSHDFCYVSQVLSCRYQTFEELQRYCYHVAGVVGLCCIHIWGIRDPRAIERATELAIDCGLAMQLTNILRDVAADADVGRVYLPAEDFARFGYSPEQLRGRVRNDAFGQLMAFEAARARDCYARSEELMSLIEPTGRPILWAMRAIYGGVLKEIERRDFDVFTRRVSLPVSRKMWVALQAYVMHAMTDYSVRLMRLMSFARRIPVGWPIAVYVLLGAISGWRNSVALNDLCRQHGTPLEKAVAMTLIALLPPFGVWWVSVIRGPIHEATREVLPTLKGWHLSFPEMHRFNRQSQLWLLGAIRFGVCGIVIGVIVRSFWDAQWYVWSFGFWLLMLGSAQLTYRIAREQLLTDEER